jgi:hypothetical protein
MANDRYPQGTQPGDYYNARGMDYGDGRVSGGGSSARDYEAAGEIGPDRGRDRNWDRGDREEYGRGNQDYYGGRPMGSQPDRGYYQGRDQDRGGYDRGYRADQRGGYGADDRSSSRGTPYRGSYASDGHRFEDVGRYEHRGDDDRSRRERQGGMNQQRRYGRQPEGYDYDERGFMARAGDEVMSWFGDDDAERRREMDSRYDERDQGGRQAHHRDSDYHNWRREQIDALDRDYAEYRRENQDKFHHGFSSWRSNRQGQRDALSKVEEHAEVVGSDGEHVGTVDKVRGDRLLLTKSDKDAGGHHHSIPSRWIDSADGKKVTLAKTAAEAKQAWKDEDRNQAMFGDGDNARNRDGTTGNDRALDKSFSGTY